MFTMRMRADLIGLCVAAAVSVPAAAEPFYQGKRLAVLVNYAPGGPTDIEGRLFAKHIGRHIDGQPAIVVQNMDGAGGLVGTSYLGEIAPKDGSMMGYLTGAAWTYASEPDKYRVDLRSYEFIAYQPGTVVYYVRTDVEPGMKEAGDIVKAKGLVSGGLAADNAKDLLIRLTLDMLGVPYRHVTGYRSNSAARLAVQRNEIGFFSESPPGYRSVVEPSMVKSGLVVPLYYDPSYDGASLTVPKQAGGCRSCRSTSSTGKPRARRHPDSCGTSISRPDHQRHHAAADRAAAAGAASRGRSPPRGGAPAQCRRRICRGRHQGHGLRAAVRGGPRHQPPGRQALAVRPEIRTFVADYIKSGRK